MSSVRTLLCCFEPIFPQHRKFQDEEEEEEMSSTPVNTSHLQKRLSWVEKFDTIRRRASQITSTSDLSINNSFSIDENSAVSILCKQLLQNPTFAGVQSLIALMASGSSQCLQFQQWMNKEPELLINVLVSLQNHRGGYEERGVATCTFLHLLLQRTKLSESQLQQMAGFISNQLRLGMDNLMVDSTGEQFSYSFFQLFEVVCRRVPGLICLDAADHCRLLANVLCHSSNPELKVKAIWTILLIARCTGYNPQMELSTLNCLMTLMKSESPNSIAASASHCLYILQHLPPDKLPLARRALISRDLQNALGNALLTCLRLLRSHSFPLPADLPFVPLLQLLDALLSEPDEIISFLNTHLDTFRQVVMALCIYHSQILDSEEPPKDGDLIPVMELVRVIQRRKEHLKSSPSIQASLRHLLDLVDSVEVLLVSTNEPTPSNHDTLEEDQYTRLLKVLQHKELFRRFEKIPEEGSHSSSPTSTHTINKISLPSPSSSSSTSIM